MDAEAIQIDRMLFSVADYHKMIKTGILGEDDNVELIKGDIIKMSPIYTPHSSHLKIISKYLHKYLPYDDVIIGVQDPITIVDLNSEPQPDLSVAKYKATYYSDEHPTPEDLYLVVEVADSTLRYDRLVKAPLYAAAGIPEYWIINVNASQAEVYRNPQNGEYQERANFLKGDTFTFAAFDLMIKTDDILG